MSAPHSSNRSVPGYAPDGRRLHNYTLRDVQKFLAMDPPAVLVKRHRRTGAVCSIQFLPCQTAAPARPIRLSAYKGQSYSYREVLEDQLHRAWTFARILIPRTDDIAYPEDFERALLAVFRAVPLSCMNGSSQAQAAAAQTAPAAKA